MKVNKFRNEIKNIILIHEDLNFNRIIFHFEDSDELVWTSIETFKKCYLREDSFNYYNIIIKLVSLENFESYKKTLKLNKLKNEFF